MKTFIFIAFLTLGLAWDCGGARALIKSTVKLNHLNMLRNSTTAPIRIHYEYIDFDLGSETLNEYFKETLMTAADSFFKHTMKVRSVIGNLSLHEAECEVIVPEEHLRYGIPNADMVIYVTSSNLPNESYIAYAAPCELDAGFRDMPIMGMVNINSPYFEEGTFASHYSTVVHELYHVFGFNSGLYPYWKKPDGSAYGEDEVTENITIRGASKTILKTPNILEQARVNFDCATIQGVELEDHGGEGTAGSHWDMRIMYNDYMMGKDIEDPIYSSITLALLKDTGWFEVDYTYTTNIMFGYKSGCDFIDKPCMSNGKSNFPELFCDDINPKNLHCDPFHIWKSSCSIYKFTEVPEAYQYYLARSWGGDPYADYCVTFAPHSDGNCRSANSTKVYKLLGTKETVSPSSRCFESTLTTGNKLMSYAACYQVLRCMEFGAYVLVDKETVLCPFTGGKFTVKGFLGYINCPSSRILCENFPCIDGCSGRGQCVNGKCICDEGFGGSSCFSRISG